MGTRITGVEAGSLAEKKRIRSGDMLLAINGREIRDVLDYRFAIVDTRLKMELRAADGSLREVIISKAEYDDPGLCFDTYLMDSKHSCRNGCVFCFIDQLPKGMRESLYFKDDDERLSFLMGNYITLTNLTSREVERIIEMHLSPVNISVHTTNPELRVRMMRNKNAGEALKKLYALAEAGIAINCQLVLCPGLNDGPELDRSLRDLGALYPAVKSIAAVPVGLTRHRKGLYELQSFDKRGASAVLVQMRAFSDAFFEKNGTRLAYPADEFFLKAGEPIPEESFYGDFAQLENGVGMLSLFCGQFDRALAEMGDEESKNPRRLSVATGTAAYPFIRRLCEKAAEKMARMECSVYAVKNEFFGENVNVSGLVTGGDLIAQLKGRNLGEQLLIPSNMLRSEGDLFLDGVSLEGAAQALGVPVVPVESDGYAFLDALTGSAG